MKKKFIYLALSLLFLLGAGYCEEGLENTFKTTSMPTDEEIMQTIDKFNFSKEQKEYLFKETKKRLLEMYENQNFAPILEGDTTLIDNSSKTKEQATKTKKYSKHDSLMKRDKQSN